ncbi:MAG: efflux RND transporter periplasmic adaptor subunit [Opitutaceae bacterium]|jgi:RND family efflux transporter MFP subunit|nr:efflux RND transporter periplasmic adaptor subunit [Opitutaceae bacterium]
MKKPTTLVFAAAPAHAFARAFMHAFARTLAFMHAHAHARALAHAFALVFVHARALALALALALFACAPLRAAPSAETRPVLAVNAAAPAQLDWPVAIPAGGWFAPWQEAVIASEIDGLRITEILADTGDIVKQGQPLATLAQDTVLAELRRCEAAVDSAEAQHASAQAGATRARLLHPSGAQTEQQLDEALNAEKTAAATLAMARADLDAQRIRLRQTTITAPDDGIIATRTATLGAVVAPGAELYRLIRRQRIEWQAEVAAQHAPAIRPGQPAVITLPDGATIAGAVRAIAPAAARDTARTLVYVSIAPDACARIKSGAYASGSITLATTPALTVPETALVLRDGLHYLYTLLPPPPPENDTAARNAARHVTRVRVETGRRRDGLVEITKGLASDARVVQSGGTFLADGAAVTLVSR